MNQISRDDVLKLASLSSLQLDEDEIEGLRTDIASILAYAKQLDELDTTKVEPVYQVTGLENVYRNDSIDQGGITREALLALAPQTSGPSIKVPKVI
jgi:aspartyl-tRNA(Asn)/glutamyl-tRNA(Gln) amidotransferase subunit C